MAVTACPCRKRTIVMSQLQRAMSWMFACRDKLSQEDHERYSKQYTYIQQICQLYDTEPNNYPKLVDLLQQVHELLTMLDACTERLLLFAVESVHCCMLYDTKPRAASALQA